jgi:hypothetical protein
MDLALGELKPLLRFWVMWFLLPSAMSLVDPDSLTPFTQILKYWTWEE